MSSNPPGKNRPNQNQVGIPVGTNRPRPNQPADSGSGGTPPNPPSSSGAQYNPNAPLTQPSRSSRLNRTERIREVAQGSGDSGGTAPARRSSSGTRAGSVSKKALGVATPSASARAAAERAARERTNRQIRILLVVAGILLVGVVLLVAFLGSGNNTSNNVAQLPSADQTQTAVAASANITPTAVLSATGVPTLAYPGGPAPTAAPILTPETPPVAGPVLIDVDKGVADKVMTVVTNRGTITFDLYSNAAPKTVANYELRANRGEFNGRKWHRVEDWVLQGNDPVGNGTGGGNLTTELNKVPFKVGSLGVARAQLEYSNDSQFFIVKSADVTKYQNFTFLNATFDAKGQPTGGYTNFGQVTSGQDVVDAMQIGDIIYTVKVTNKDGSTTAAPTAAPTAATGGTLTNTTTLTGTGAVSSTNTTTSTGTTAAATPTTAAAAATATTAPAVITPTEAVAATPTK